MTWLWIFYWGVCLTALLMRLNDYYESIPLSTIVIAVLIAGFAIPAALVYQLLIDGDEQ